MFTFGGSNWPDDPSQQSRLIGEFSKSINQLAANGLGVAALLASVAAKVGVTQEEVEAHIQRLAGPTVPFAPDLKPGAKAFVHGVLSRSQQSPGS